LARCSEKNPPGLRDRIVTRVAVQQAAYDEPLDDPIVDGRGADDSVSRLSLRTKRELTISAATTNDDFREIITGAWAMLQKPSFRQDVDRVGGGDGITELRWNYGDSALNRTFGLSAVK